MEAAHLCLHTHSLSFSNLISLFFLLILKSLTSEQLSEKHESIFSGSLSDVMKKDLRAARSSALV